MDRWIIGLLNTGIYDEYEDRRIVTRRNKEKS